MKGKRSQSFRQTRRVVDCVRRVLHRSRSAALACAKCVARDRRVLDTATWMSGTSAARGQRYSHRQGCLREPFS
jgi:hypothetical protein